MIDDAAAYLIPYHVKLGGQPARGMGKKIFVGRLPPEATAEDLRLYFGRFGHIVDVYVPKVSSMYRSVDTGVYSCKCMHEKCLLTNLPAF